MVDYPNIFALGQTAFKNAYDQQTSMRQDRASQAAGQAIAAGDYTGGANAFNNAGMVDQAHNVVADQQVIQDRQTAASNLVTDRATKAQQLKVDGMLRLTDALQAVPEGQRQGWLQKQIPLIQQLGLPADQFANLDESHLTDASLIPWKAALGKAKEDYTIGAARYSGSTNKPIAGFAEFDPKKTIYAVGDAPPAAPGGPTTSTLGDAVPPPPAAPPGATPQPAVSAAASAPPPQAVWNSIIQQESGGKPGVTGPQTAYGQAQGETQLLPATAQSMAHKLGVAWQPDLMTGTSPEAAAYQEKLGQAYFQEGLQKYGGDVQRAAMYYYGGPDEKLWGPKTHAYAQQVLARAGGAPGAADTLAGGAGQDALPPPAQIAGFHVVSQAKPEWQDMADGRQRNTITGKVEGTATATDDVPLTKDAVDLLAGKYLNNGTLPTMGMGKTGTRNRAEVLNRATEMAKSLGLDANDLVAGTLNVKAAGLALNKATTMRSQVEGSEQTVLKNAQYALSLAPQGGGPLGSPVLNRWIQAGRKNVAGDPQVAAFDQSIRTVAEEYAKVMTTTTGNGGVSSDSARNEAYKRLDGAMNPDQLRAVITSMKVEMDNRAASLRDVEAGLRTNIRSGGQPGMSAPTSSYSPPPAAPPANRPPLTSFQRR